MKRTICSAVLLLASLAAFAQPYVRGDALMGLSKSDAGGALGIGYRFGRHVALEATLADLPTAEKTGGETVGSTQTSRLQSWEGRGVGVSAVGLLPIAGGWSLAGRAGAMRVDARITSSVTVTDLAALPAPGIRTTTDSRETYWAPAFGLGAQYDEGRTGVRVMYEQVRGPGSQPIDLKMLTFGASWSF